MSDYGVSGRCAIAPERRLQFEYAHLLEITKVDVCVNRWTMDCCLWISLGPLP